MKIGTMQIEIFGELNFDRAVEHFNSMVTPILKTISDSFEFDYTRFAFVAATLTLFIPLRIFWRSDAFYNALIRALNYCFSNWQFDITLHIIERED